jgi:hypothetical protein
MEMRSSPAHEPVGALRAQLAPPPQAPPLVITLRIDTASVPQWWGGFAEGGVGCDAGFFKR